jgi:hypothetical protein
MTANPQDFAYFSRGESPPWNKGSGATTGFDYFQASEAYPAAIPSVVGGLIKTSAGVTKPTKIFPGGVTKPVKFKDGGGVWQLA